MERCFYPNINICEIDIAYGGTGLFCFHRKFFRNCEVIFENSMVVLAFGFLVCNRGAYFVVGMASFKYVFKGALTKLEI